MICKLNKNSWVKISDSACTFFIPPKYSNDSVVVMVSTSMTTPGVDEGGIPYQGFTPIPIYSENAVYAKLYKNTKVEEVDLEVQNFI
ncbi:MAG: hypothetical protein ACRCX2_19790 [Paraclostridium sp.]